MKHGNDAESSEPIPGTVLVKFKRMNPFIYHLTFFGEWSIPLSSFKKLLK